eukprot:31530-Pelagococcus_subviridis.AAC.7
MRPAKSLRIGVHHADGVVWEPVYRTRLAHASERPAARRVDVRLHRLAKRLLDRPFRAAEVPDVPFVPVPDVQQHRRGVGIVIRVVLEHRVPTLRRQRDPASRRIGDREMPRPALELHELGLVPQRELRVRLR